MFLPTKMHEEAIDYEKNIYTVRIGESVPHNAVNLAYYYNKKNSHDFRFIISEGFKNEYYSKVVKKWITKDDLNVVNPNVFPSSSSYNDLYGYSGQLQIKSIDWTCNKHVEKETKDYNDNLKSLTTNSLDNIYKKQVEDGLYVGTQYLMDSNFEVTSFKEVYSSELIYKERNEEKVVISDSNVYDFPNNINYDKNGYSGTLYKNGDMEIDVMFSNVMLENSIGNITKNYFGKFDINTNCPKQYINEAGLIYTLKDLVLSKNTAEQWFSLEGNTEPVNGSTQSYTDSNTGEVMELTYNSCDGSFVKNADSNQYKAKYTGYSYNTSAVYEALLKEITSLKYKLTQRYSAILCKENSKIIKVPSEYKANISYKGVLKHTWYDYWGTALYIGSVSRDSNKKVEIQRSLIKLLSPKETGVFENWYPIIQFKEEIIEYRGYYDHEGNFIDLDINPNMYHSYLDNTSDNYERKLVYTLFNTEIYFFKKNSSVEGSLNSSIFYHKIASNVSSSEDDIMIGSISLRQTSSLESTILIDTRTRGGGILYEISDNLRKQLEPESDYYWDIGYFDGKPYNENAVIIIRLDRRILKDFGGKFTAGEVENAVNKWVAIGVLPIIEYVTTYNKEELPQSSLNVDFIYKNKLEFTPYAFSTVVKE